MKNWMKLAAASVFALSIAACNTVEGVGRDVEEVGDAVEDTAEENKN